MEEVRQATALVTKSTKEEVGAARHKERERGSEEEERREEWQMNKEEITLLGQKKESHDKHSLGQEKEVAKTQVENKGAKTSPSKKRIKKARKQ